MARNFLFSVGAVAFVLIFSEGVYSKELEAFVLGKKCKEANSSWLIQELVLPPACGGKDVPIKIAFQKDSKTDALRIQWCTPQRDVSFDGVPSSKNGGKNRFVESVVKMNLLNASQPAARSLQGENGTSRPTKLGGDYTRVLLEDGNKQLAFFTLGRNETTIQTLKSGQTTTRITTFDCNVYMNMEGKNPIQFSFQNQKGEKWTDKKTSAPIRFDSSQIPSERTAASGGSILPSSPENSSNSGNSRIDEGVDSKVNQ